MLKTNIKEKGFTIVELLIVIVIIGILGLLVLNTVTGAQKRARDSDRQSDITALATQLEVYYNDKGGYPLFTQIDGADAEGTPNAVALFPGLDANAVRVPGQDTGESLVNSAATDKDQYGYVAEGCTADLDSCEGFTLTYFTEDGNGESIPKESLNKPTATP